MPLEKVKNIELFDKILKKISVNILIDPHVPSQHLCGFHKIIFLFLLTLRAQELFHNSLELNTHLLLFLSFPQLTRHGIYIERVIFLNRL